MLKTSSIGKLQCRPTLRQAPLTSPGLLWRPTAKVVTVNARNTGGYNYPDSGSNYDKYQSSSSAPGNYYPPIPPYQPAEPSAPYLPTDPTSYNTSSTGNGSDYRSRTSARDAYGSTYNSSTPSDYAASTYTSSIAGDAEADLDLVPLQRASGAIRTLSFLGFWIQFPLAIVSAGILLFSSAFVPQQVSGNAVVNVSKWLTLGGVVAAFISAFMQHGFNSLAQKLQEGGKVGRGYLVGTLLTNNAICLAGIAITVIGLQASVGTLVAKALMSNWASNPYQAVGANSLVSLDVFALQASTNTLLCHVAGLIFTNMTLRVVNRATSSNSAPPKAA